MFVEKENDAAQRAAIEAGVSAYVVDGLTPRRVRPIIDVAIARFKIVDGLRSELKKTKEDLAARKVIERAKGLLMKSRDMSEEEAYAAMRTMSQERGKPLKEVAESVISVLTLLGGPAIGVAFWRLRISRLDSQGSLIAPPWSQPKNAASLRKSDFRLNSNDTHLGPQCAILWPMA